jgi:hypothetical protein
MISTLRRADLDGQTRLHGMYGRISVEAHTRRRESALAELTDELAMAVDGAYWTYLLQAELEDAFDTALLRAAMSETPILAGALPSWGFEPGALAR